MKLYDKFYQFAANKITSNIDLENHGEFVQITTHILIKFKSKIIYGEFVKIELMNRKTANI